MIKANKLIRISKRRRKIKTRKTNSSNNNNSNSNRTSFIQQSKGRDSKPIRTIRRTLWGNNRNKLLI